MEDYKKRYEEALSQAEKELKCCGSLDCDAARQIFRLFPELKESEDERIRKTLKSFFDSEISDYGNVEWRNGIRYSEIIAWLEKQGKQKPAWSEEDENGLGDALWAIEQARTIAKDENEMGGLWYAEKWLKSLKERMKGE